MGLYNKNGATEIKQALAGNVSINGEAGKPLNLFPNYEDDLIQYVTLSLNKYSKKERRLIDWITAIKDEDRPKEKQLTNRRNYLFHKLIRIQKQFRFVKKHQKKFQTLTSREKEVIQHLGEGNSNPDIAKKLFISRYTVEQHRKNINRKLKIKSFSHLLKYVYAFDLI